LDDPTSQIFVVTVDGTDFKVWEKKHATMPYDKAQYSHKFNHMRLIFFDRRLSGSMALTGEESMTKRSSRKE
jgi:hypothetical protein